MNMYGFGFLDQYLQQLDLLSHKSGIDYIISYFHTVFFDGKMRGLFTLLFGASIIMFTSKKEENGLPMADAYFRRMMWLLAFGLLNAYVLLMHGDVLYEYSLCGILLFVFRNLRVRYLLLFALLCFSINMYKSTEGFRTLKNNRITYLETEQLLKQGKVLTEEQITARKEWTESANKMPPFDKEHREEFVKESSDYLYWMKLDYVGQFKKFIPLVVESQSKDFYRYLWQTFGTIILGMALFKLGIFEPGFKTRTLLIFIFLGALCVPFSFHYLNVRAVQRADFIKLVDERQFASMYFWETSRVILTLAYLSILILFCRINILPGIKKALAAVGKTAISNYFLQTICCTLLFNSYGLGMYNKLHVWQVYLFVVGVWIFQIILSVIWLRYFKMGPVEWLWRSLIYKKLIPNKITD